MTLDLDSLLGRVYLLPTGRVQVIAVEPKQRVRLRVVGSKQASWVPWTLFWRAVNEGDVEAS